MEQSPAEARRRRAIAKRARRGVEVDRRRQQDAKKAAWAQRHPRIAAQERSFRKARAGLLKRWDHKKDGTPETHEHVSRISQGALAQLCRNGTIDHHQLAAAVQIAETAERIGADVAVRTASLETRVDSGGRREAALLERLGQVRREVAYTQWRRAIGPARIMPVMEMIAGDGAPIGFTIVARRHGMHNRRARSMLIEALDLWIRTLGQVCKEIDEASVTAAWAGLS